MAKVNVTSTIVQFTVSDVSKLTEIRLPEVLVQGIPWQILVKKVTNDGNQPKSLGYYFYCTKNDESADYSHPAACSIKLIPFRDGQDVVESFLQPHVYDICEEGLGFSSFIEWHRLFDVENGNVKDDTIKLELKIEAEDPNKVDKSKLIFECVDKSCDCGCQANYRLTVTNIANLLAVKSPEFTLRENPFDLTIFKDHKSNLGIYFNRKDTLKNVTSKMTITAKLVSSKSDQLSVTKTKFKQFKDMGSLLVPNIQSWQELMKPENGFIQGNSIIIDVKIECGKRGGDTSNGSTFGAMNKAKTPKWGCVICLENLNDQNISGTPCGHMFCTDCITKAIDERKACPTCNTTVRLGALQRMYLPIEFY